MAIPRVHRLGDLQWRVMQVLWSRPQATVTEVHHALAGERTLAYTTVATLLRRLEQRGLVKHHLDGRAFVYQARIAMDAAAPGATDHILDRLFEGRLSDLVSHLLSRREVSREELAQLERLIAEKKRRL